MHAHECELRTDSGRFGGKKRFRVLHRCRRHHHRRRRRRRRHRRWAPTFTGTTKNLINHMKYRWYFNDGIEGGSGFSSVVGLTQRLQTVRPTDRSERRTTLFIN